MFDIDFQLIPNYLSDRLNSIGLIRIDNSKTKFNQIRVYVGFGAYSVRDLIPDKIFFSNGFVKILNNRFYKVPRYRLNTIRIPNFINYLLIPYQRFVYRQIYKHTIKKFPKYKMNIISGADYSELLKGL